MQHNDIYNMSAFDFPVKMIPIYHLAHSKFVEDASCIDGYQAVIRTDTMKVLAVHSSRYRLTTHADVFKSTIDILTAEFGLLKDIIINDHVMNSSAMVMREIRLPTHSITDPTGHTIQLRIRQINSYDATSRYVMTAGSYRQWCSNGAASLIAKITSTHQKHTSKIDIGAEKNKLKRAIVAFYDEAKTWKEWYEYKLDAGGYHHDAIVGFLGATLCAVPTSGNPLNVNKKQLNILMTAWERNSLELGRNKWALFNAMTWWASHGESEKRGAEEISLEREPMVLAAVQGKEWDAL